MTKQVINIGTAPNAKNGDPLRTAFDKINDNFTELYSSLGADGQLPPQTGNANKYLKTDGTTLSWSTVASGVTSYTALTDKPTLFSGSYTDLTNKPTIPTSFSSLVNGAHQLVLDVNGTTPYVTFPEVAGGSIIIQGSEIAGVGSGAASIAILTSAESDVRLSANAAGTRKNWTFGTEGSLAYPNSALQRDTGTVTCLGNASTVVYTASSDIQYTIKLLIQVEGFEGAAAATDSQACEMIVTKSFRADDIAASVYGVVHTSVAPLATFTAEWNALTSRIQVLCATPSANAVNVRIFATEIQYAP